MYPTNMTKTRAITEPVHIGNHPMKVNVSIEKNEVIGTVVMAPFPLVAIKTIKRSEMVSIKERITPASLLVVFIKSATFCRY